MSTTTTRREKAPDTRGPVRKLLTSFGFQIIAALVLGVVAGLIAVNLGASATNPTVLSDTLGKIGSSYVTLLKAAVVPLIFTAIVASISNLRRVQNAARLAGQTILWFAITAFIAVIIGIVLGLVIQPGARAGQDLETGDPYAVGTWWNFLLGLIPQNFLGLTVSTGPGAVEGTFTSNVGFNILQVIVVAAVVGIAALKAGRKAEPFLAFTESLLKVIQRVLWWIIRIAPIGTFGLIGSAVVQYGWDKLASLAWFAGAVYIGLALVIFVVYPVLIKSHGLSIKQYFSGVWPAVQLGFVSRSSIGTLPLTERVTERNLGVPRAYASFAVPLGATTKMDGCAAIYPAIAAIFVAQFFGVDLNFFQYLLIVIVSVVGSAATAGTTGAVVMLTLTLSTLGLPLEGVGLLLAIDPILDMGRTAVNVAGQALVPTIVAKREGILDLDLYNAPREGLPFAEDLDDSDAADREDAAHAALADAKHEAAEAAAEAEKAADDTDAAEPASAR
ncbi:MULTISPECIES: dicarboxylate/amino acid:cation symporter [unclassified Microbacterium]|uniref:dicarboxylate/amino acid:cation symporter n=1 Tax=unclassified Microbacterium TaxID=2609290 RepID=UPI0012F957A5|nr:dicarboxylate/amino acid:cation symporter [Microbacterium sp. MAH-37]MVQ43410.1 cation:dicarboxylase symporter family transporter [Microbacterium sp. MAH-37]